MIGRRKLHILGRQRLPKVAQLAPFRQIWQVATKAEAIISEALRHTNIVIE